LRGGPLLEAELLRHRRADGHRRARWYGEVLGPSIAGSESMRAWGSRYARLVFERCGRNKRTASRFLEISYHTLEAYLGYGYPNRASGRRVPGWARPEPDAAPPVTRARETIDM